MGPLVTLVALDLRLQDNQHGGSRQSSLCGWPSSSVRPSASACRIETRSGAVPVGIVCPVGGGTVVDQCCIVAYVVGGFALDSGRHLVDVREFGRGGTR